MRPVISLGEGQCFREVSEVPRAWALPWLHSSAGLPHARDVTGLVSLLEGICPIRGCHVRAIAMRITKLSANGP